MMHYNSYFQNIIYVTIVRTNDGMPLSASTDFTDEINKNIKECKKYIKILSKKALQFPEKCVLHLPDYNIFFISYLGVTYLMLCSISYPAVLAFSFLNELMKEFVTIYDKKRIDNVVRPYNFLQFDNFIHKTCQRYNKPQNLTTRINLSELSLEIKLRPPYVIKLEEIIPTLNCHTQDMKLPFTVNHKLKYEDLSFISFMTMSLSIILSFVSLFRGISTLNEINMDELYSRTHTRGVVFVLDSFLRQLQAYVLWRHMRQRALKAWILFIVLIYLTWWLLEIRDTWQTVIYTFTLISVHFSVLFRKVQDKLPDYQV